MQDLEKHILHLQGLLEQLQQQLPAVGRSISERDSLERQRHVIKLALSYCRAALDLEKRLADL
ncbi:hypothetical protein [Occallatibacter savannae]|uniref:hypothetical protein n=1 Tax=Occallatibacter savannae TaxID=1002691 RepID=UPI000D69487A|nr:hypothetical protein [Occallatibacter savannae]